MKRKITPIKRLRGWSRMHRDTRLKMIVKVLVTQFIGTFNNMSTYTYPKLSFYS